MIPTTMSPRMPPGPSPGTTQRATKPTIKPKTIQASIPNVSYLLVIGGVVLPPLFTQVVAASEQGVGVHPVDLSLMKGTFLCLLLAFACAAPAIAETPGITEITVTGRGAVSLAPNVAVVSASVQSNAPTAARALAANNASYDAIVAALTRLGVARDDITMAGYNVNYVAPRPDQSDGERSGYTVSRDFSVKVRNIAKAGEVTDACISAGATAINGVQFTIADNAAARERAVALAVADARKSAVLLARESALQVVGIAKVSLDAAGDTGPIMMRMAAARPTAFDQGNIEVSASVTVVFLAKP